jgi:hypothetical protein
VNVTVCTASKVCPPPGDTPTWSINKLDSSDFVVAVNGLDTTDDAGDGIVQVTVKQGAVTDLISGNPNRTSVLPPIVWDAHSAPTVSGDGYPTSDSSIQYLVTFPPLAASTKVLASDFTATSSAVDPKSVLQTACPSGTVTGYQCFKVSVVVSGAPPSPQQISLSVNDGTAGKVLDQWGLPIPGSVSPANVTWTNTPLTIIPKATQGSGSAIFSGLASTAPGDGPTVSVDLCTDMKCSSPVSIGPPIPTGPGASWTSPAVPTAPNSTYWARVTQTLAGNPTIVMTGPFQT